ncbi:MAG: hypothetical protein J6X88_10615 [Bacteroidales bacterium]|nr:hypothetical protein [Bacteroidales bacterium]
MRLLRKILGGISLTAAMFVFQACYGIEEPTYPIQFRVTAADDGSPLANIKIESQTQSGSGHEYNWFERGRTDSAGVSTVWMNERNILPTKFRFSDDDSLYVSKDSVLVSHGYYDTIDIRLSRVN